MRLFELLFQEEFYDNLLKCFHDFITNKDILGLITQINYFDSDINLRVYELVIRFKTTEDVIAFLNDMIIKNTSDFNQINENFLRDNLQKTRNEIKEQRRLNIEGTGFLDSTFYDLNADFAIAILEKHFNFYYPTIRDIVFNVEVIMINLILQFFQAINLLPSDNI